MTNPSPRTELILSRIREVTSPEVFSTISAHLAEELLRHNNNINQTKLSPDMAGIKPAVLREIAIGSNLGDEEMDNQNQNQGKLADLMAMKPEALRQLKVSLRGEQFMDNQNQNQGTHTEAALDEAAAKPRLG